jgi:hypothetical protein
VKSEIGYEEKEKKKKEYMSEMCQKGAAVGTGKIK